MAFSKEDSQQKVQALPAKPEGSGEAEFQVVAIWRTLTRRGWLVVMLTLVGAGCALLAALLATKTYSATATIEVNRQAETPLGVGSLNGINEQFGSTEEMEASLLTVQAELKGATIALDVIRQLGLDSLPAYGGGAKRAANPEKKQGEVLRRFESHLQVTLVKDTKLIEVTFSDPDPRRAALVANTVINTYVRSYSQARTSTSAKASALLAAQLADLRSQVVASEKRVNDYKARTGLVGSSETSATGDQPSADSVVNARFVELNRQLTAAKIASVGKMVFAATTETHDPDVVLGALSTNLTTSPDGGSPGSFARADLDLLASLRQQRSQLMLQKATRATQLGAEHPQMLQLDAQIAEIDKQIDAELDRIHTQARSELQIALDNENGLRRLVDQQRSEVTRLNIGNTQLTVLEQEANSERQLYQDLYAKLQEVEVSRGIEPSTITVTDPARTPTEPSAPKPVRNLAAGLVGGALLGVFGAFLLDYVDDRIYSAEDVTGLLAPSCMLGSIPFATVPAAHDHVSGAAQADRATKYAVLLNEPTSAIAEAIRSLRNSLLLKLSNGQKRILFTNSDEEDGKTFLGFNSAIAFALLGAKVLLIETDLHRPRLQQISGASKDVGLVHYLEGKASLREAILPYHPIDSLHLLLGGTSSSQASDLLGSKRFAMLMDLAAAEYDFILLTGPSAILFSDTLAVAPHTDCTVVVARSGKTSKQQIRQTLARLGDVRPCLVVNGVKAATPQEDK